MSGTASDRRGAVADLAASALLGALLSDPERIGDVADWLHPNDFARWGDRAVYATLVGLCSDGQPIDILELPDVIASGKYHDAHVQRTDGRGPLSAAALHTYLSIAGLTSSEHTMLAQLVLDDSIRRRVEELGTRIDQHARHIAGQDSASAAETLAGVLADVHARLRQLTGRLDEAHQGRSGITSVLNPRTPPHAAGRGRHQDGHDPGPSRAAAPDPRDLRRAELTLIGASMMSPGVRELVEGRLQARDFATPEIAATWEAVRSLRWQQLPVDVVFVAAEVERLGELPDIGRGLEPDQLLRLVQRFEHVAPVVAYKAMETVVGAALGRAVHGGGEQLHALLGDRTRSSQELLTSAQRIVSSVESSVRRLTETSPSGAALTALTPPKGQIPEARQRSRSDEPTPPRAAAPPPARTSRHR
jgi:replicative DNA helicase